MTGGSTMPDSNAKAHILVVDDEPDVIETILFGLEMEGYSVMTAGNGLEALGAVRARQPDLVVLDVMLPGENGYRVAHFIREDEARGVYDGHIPIILLTARDLSREPEREEMFREFSQADVMMYKPFDLDDLVGTIEKLLEGGR